MKTKIIPFDLEMAKKIQAGEIKGKIIYNHSEAEIVDFELYFKGQVYVCARTKGNTGCYSIRLFDKNGKDPESSAFYELLIEVPYNEPQFKPFDRVLVRDDKDSVWRANLFSHIIDGSPFRYACAISNFKQCIQYEGNEDLVGTINKPKED